VADPAVLFLVNDPAAEIPHTKHHQLLGPGGPDDRFAGEPTVNEQQILAAGGDVTPRDEQGRILPEVFELPVAKMRAGYYADVYFNFTRDTLLNAGRRPRVLMQVFQRKQSVLAGIDEAIAILKLCSHDWKALEVKALREGDEVSPWETVMTIEGDYTHFAHLETAYLGVLARRTVVATNVRKTVAAANGKPILFFPARHDHHLVQTGDGFAAHVGGAIGVSTDANASWWGGHGVGTCPHALIAAFGGDTVAAARAYADWAPAEMNIAVLVDFDNDSCKTAIEVADALEGRLWGVRLDTSGQLVDRCLIDDMGDFPPTGVNEQLVRKVRAALDAAGHPDVRILVSGGFSLDRIAAFEAAGVPVDSYGVGSSLIRGSNDFTADVVLTDGKPSAKVGRWLRPNPRLELVR
jgi:nicotinate phosphoribosyltransferase